MNRARLARRRGTRDDRAALDAVEKLLARPRALEPQDTDGTESHVLVVDARMLTPDQDSGSLRMFAILKLLRRMGHSVTFVSDGEEPQTRYARGLRELGVETQCGFSAAVAHLARLGHRYRFVVLSRPEIALHYLPAVRAHAPHATVIYDTVDLRWVRMLRAAELADDSAAREQAEWCRRVERAVAACADMVIAITSHEKEMVLMDVPAARVEVLPNIHACRPSVPPLHGRKDLMFIGGFEHRPNVDAVQWFVQRILPLVRQEIPDAVFQVVGSKPPREVLRLRSRAVHVVGYVADARPYFDRSRVFVAPLRYGAGMKGKIGQSMSHGLPIVTTTIGAEGMSLVDGENVLIADQAEAFARAVVKLYLDPELWAKLSTTSLRHVREHLSEDAAQARLEALFPVSAG